MAKTASPSQKPKEETLETIDKKIDEKRKKFAEVRGASCFPLFMANAKIVNSSVDDIFDDLKKNFSECTDIDVIIDSGGGYIDAAFNIALLFRQYVKGRLTFIVPRWAKSAATPLACSGDEILMTPPAELGPLDPQITEMNPMEKRMEQFSPLHIEATLELIREEFAKGHEKLATGLMNRLQFPLTLGSYRKSLDVSRQYLFELLSTRMLSGDTTKAKQVAEKLTTGYVDHSYCIKCAEAAKIGLKAVPLEGEQLDIAWEIHKLNKRRAKLALEERRKKLKKQMKDLPSDLLDILPDEVLGTSREMPPVTPREDQEIRRWPSASHLLNVGESDARPNRCQHQDCGSTFAAESRDFPDGHSRIAIRRKRR